MEDLPTELIRLIFSCLQNSNSARAVNRRWCNIIDKRLFGTYFVRDDQLEDLVDTFSRCTKPIHLSFNKNKFGGIKGLCKYITKLSTLTGLEIEMLREPAEDSDWMALTVLTNLQYLGTYGILQSLYSHLMRLTSIESLRTADPLELGFLTNLTRLEFLCVDCNKGFNPFHLIKNPPILKELTVSGQIQYSLEDLNPFVGLKNLTYYNKSERPFPLSMFNKLEYLDISSFDIDEYPASLRELGVLDVPPHHLTKLTDLHYLRVNCNDRWSDDNKRRLVTYIKSLGLTELRLLQLDIPDAQTFSNYLKELTKFQKLEKLWIALDRCMQDIPTLNQELNALTNLAEMFIRFPGQRGRQNSISIEISTMTKLTRLTLYGCNISFENAPLMTALKSINGISCREIRRADLLQLTNLEAMYRFPITPKMVNVLTTFQHLTYFSVDDASPQMYRAIAHLTKLKSLFIPIAEGPNIELWTNLRQLTWFEPIFYNVEPVQYLTLLTSLERLTPTISSAHQIDEQKLIDKLPRLYDIYIRYVTEDEAEQ